MSAVRAIDRQCLVLNANFSPLGTWPLSLINARDAVKNAHAETVSVLDEWEEAFRSPSISIRVPKVVALRQYVPVHSTPTFTRSNIYLRDRYCCMYCGERFRSEDLTFDHLIPRAKGGTTCWENILTACVGCNSRKGHAMPNFSGRRGKVDDAVMRPIKVPRQPTAAEMMKAGLELLDQRTLETFGDFLYWNVPLLT